MLLRNSDETLYELVATVASCSSDVNRFLRKRGLPELNTGSAAPPVALTAENAAYFDARASAIEAAEKILKVLRGPRDVLLEISFQHCASASLQVIQRYRVQDHIPLDGSISYAKLAETIGKGVSAAVLERVLQHAISFGLFAEDTNGNVMHNSVSSLLVTEPDLEAWLYLCTNVAYPAGAKIPQALETYGYSSEANESAYGVSIGRKVSQFERFREPDGDELHAMFAKAMRGISAGGAYDVRHAVEGYPWHKLAEKSQALVVDVGGGPGHVAMELAKKNPTLRFEVQDLPETVEVGAQNCPMELRERISFKPHNFFEKQPAHDVSEETSITYFARFILHDWSDKHAARILDALAKSLRPQDRVILNEVVVPAPGELPLEIERRLHDRDMLMLMNLNGRERSVKAFEALFESVEPKLCLKHVYRPSQGELSLIEVALAA